MTTDQVPHHDQASPRAESRARSVLRLSGAVGNRILGLPAASVIIATGLLIALIGGLHPNFFQATQMFDILQGSTYVGLLAVGLAYLIAMRDIDLSVGSQFALTLIIAAILMRDGMNPWLAAVITIAIGALLGLINALVVSLIRIPTIITTLATLSVYGGLATAISNGQQVVGLPTGSSFFNIAGGTIGGQFPIAVIITVAVALPIGIVLHNTPFGYRVLAIGSNPDAAAFSGISLTRVRTQVLVLIGVLCGISGCLGLAYFTSGDPTIGSNFALEAIAAAVIGGTPLRGGTASILGALIGSVLLNVVTAGLPYFGVPANWSEYVTGLVIIVAVGFDSLVRFQQGRSAARRTL